MEETFKPFKSDKPDFLDWFENGISTLAGITVVVLGIFAIGIQLYRSFGA